MRHWTSAYRLGYAADITYMLQSVLYDPKVFLKWWKRVRDFRRVQHRRTLNKTSAASKLLLLARVITLIDIVVAPVILIALIILGAGLIISVPLLVFLLHPILLPLILIVPLAVAKKLIKEPRDKALLAAATKIYVAHPGTIIAVAGSYGKTTMKEILSTVLSEGGKTAATFGNMNVPVSLAKFAQRLDGDEKFVVVEFGEGYRGDVARMSKLTDPDIGIITGLAPNHLDEYKTMDNLASDLMSLSAHLKHQNIYVAGDNEKLRSLASHGETVFDADGLKGWKVSSIISGLDGIAFTLNKGSKTFRLRSKLVGRHLIAPLALAAVLADSLGLSKREIETGVTKTKPFEHRLQPRYVHGAWIIDDSYNGNLEGMRAGLSLLAELKTTGRKVYVTPGLVDQGDETDKVHLELGNLIAQANPDQVVLMKNSATDMIQHGMASYKGEVIIADDPLKYYENLELTLANGDIVLLQNDWTDNYN